ncbi:histidine phosphatase family protein [Tumebacillus sp. ITR2]|uniref:Histidine phosphatase family protein n=1 Tax=Tumebacillus amylolyticus TaxID=2801339 RepID=A0ABS1J449_9BACL|nr:histidine phosphatase family protein [Tumebacillus amylolyticus]MBL0385058.1 histidine phosphatase family protein [Tumebacillus amylolyticus]
MQILLIRHGESEADILKVHEGRADYPMTDRGRAQARKMARHVLEKFPPDIIWASTLKRASETAEILQSAINCPIHFLDELREHNNGNLAGQPDHIGPFPWELQPHEKHGEIGESHIEFRGRAEQVFSYIRNQSQDHKRIAIVCHGGMISRLMESFLQTPVVQNLWTLSGDTAIHLIEFTPRGRLIHFTNNTNHLNDE